MSKFTIVDAIDFAEEVRAIVLKKMEDPKFEPDKEIIYVPAANSEAMWVTETLVCGMIKFDQECLKQDYLSMIDTP